MSIKLSATSLERLQPVHPHLVKVVMLAAELSDTQFTVSCGARTVEEQRLMVKKGASRTMNSRHVIAPNGLSHAVDLAVIINGAARWEAPLYAALADTVKSAARQLGVPITWGGDWRSFFDGPHFELPWDKYPGVADIADTPVPRPSVDDIRTLHIGASGAGVVDLQKRLNLFHADIRPDGYFGPKTREAVMKIQSAHGLKPDGIVGPATWGVLDRG